MISRFENFTLDAERRELRRGRRARRGRAAGLRPAAIPDRGTRSRRQPRRPAARRCGTAASSRRPRLSSRINAARAAIGDTGAEQRLIRTLPRKGVRFVAEVRSAESAGTRTPPDGAGPCRRRRACRRIAVLPFANTSGDPEQEFLGDGMAEEIITALSRMSGLFVIARNSSFAYRGGGRRAPHRAELGVGYVLEGSVRRSRERLRITGQLVDAASGAHALVRPVRGRSRRGVRAAGPGRGERRRRDRADLADRRDRAARARSARAARRLRPPAARLCPARGVHRGQHGRGARLVSSRRSRSTRPSRPPWPPRPIAARCAISRAGRSRTSAVRAEAVARAWRAVELAPDDAQVLWMAAFAIWNMAETGRERARDLFGRSLLVNPNSAMALTLAGWIETMCGNQRRRPRHGRARAAAQSARPARLAHVRRHGDRRGDRRETMPRRRDGRNRRSRRTAASRWRFACWPSPLVKLGQQDRARNAVQELLAIEPELTISGFLARIPVPLESMARTYADALQAAGLPA